MKGKYKLNKDIRARVGYTVFTSPKGTELRVAQHDKVNSKVLVAFGDGHTDWFHEAWLKRYATKAE
tara:strand:- start:45 stop:242 length:198 start_codon:yes stop_codon:yes gene_type:complete